MWYVVCGMWYVVRSICDVVYASVDCGCGLWSASAVLGRLELLALLGSLACYYLRPLPPPASGIRKPKSWIADRISSPTGPPLSQPQLYATTAVEQIQKRLLRSQRAKHRWHEIASCSMQTTSAVPQAQSHPCHCHRSLFPNQPQKTCMHLTVLHARR
jgi:hypothetical protein